MIVLHKIVSSILPVDAVDSFAGFYDVICPLGGPTWQETGGGLWSTASKELSPQLRVFIQGTGSCQQPVSLEVVFAPS